MTLPELSAIFAVILFGSISVFFSLREEKTKKSLLERERNQKQRLYEISILKEIQDRIGYELNSEKVVDVITGSLRNLFPYSTTSSLFIKEDKLVFKTYVEEPVSHIFIEQVKKNSLNSLTALIGEKIPSVFDESISGVALDDSNNSNLGSFFHIPFIINNNVVGLINISSTKPGLYKEDEMTILYRITSQASNALSKLEEVLNTEKGKLMSMIGSLADGVFMLDVNNQLLVINDAAKRLLKIQKENPGILDVLSSLPKDFDFTGKLRESVTQNKTIEEKEIKIEEKTLQVFITPVTYIKTNKVIGISVLLHDITLEKNLSQLKEDFTNMMVHELRSPLTAIKYASQLMISNKELNKDDANKMINTINDQSHLLLDYVSTLLDAAKIEAGRFTVQKENGNIKDVIQKSYEVFTPAAHEKHIDLTTSFSEELPSLSFDPIRIGQVLNNLLSNSLKFTPEGGKVTVSTKTADKEASGNSKITISVSDTGIGIPKEKQNQLFSRFSQIAKQNSPNGNLQNENPGTGLGLYIAKGIVEAHGGSISMDSDTGTGTTISFTLPVN
ncbi:MAG: GAF domain-containing sensor histidine kinase [Candidatus Levybacteria bacterium]|nr:GAF domain-containing sensor histidine kinase [Candidatus Levybacteria bacterium]